MRGSPAQSHFQAHPSRPYMTPSALRLWCICGAKRPKANEADRRPTGSSGAPAAQHGRRVTMPSRTKPARTNFLGHSDRWSTHLVTGRSHSYQPDPSRDMTWFGVHQCSGLVSRPCCPRLWCLQPALPPLSPRHAGGAKGLEPLTMTVGAVRFAPGPRCQCQVNLPPRVANRVSTTYSFRFARGYRR